MVHGNEVMGLLSLLRVAQIAAMPSLLPQKTPMTLLFIPFVNVDAYTLNRRGGKGGGCRLTNLRLTCDAIPVDMDQNNIDCTHPIPLGGDWDHPTGMTDKTSKLHCMGIYAFQGRE